MGAGPSCLFSDYETGGLWCRPDAPLMVLAFSLRRFMLRFLWWGSYMQAM